MADVFLGLGSNLGDPFEQLSLAVRQIADRMRVERVSAIYRTEPVGVPDQPDFLNAVLHARTDRDPLDLLDVLGGVEASLGRQRGVVRNGPRTIDLDLLLFDERIVEEPRLSIPHPRMTERRFVLVPLAEIAPHARHAPTGKTVAELLAELPSRQGVTRLTPVEWPPPLPR